jgi:hypothetical protein
LEGVRERSRTSRRRDWDRKYGKGVGDVDGRKAAAVVFHTLAVSMVHAGERARAWHDIRAAVIL